MRMIRINFCDPQEPIALRGSSSYPVLPRDNDHRMPGLVCVCVCEFSFCVFPAFAGVFVELPHIWSAYSPHHPSMVPVPLPENGLARSAPGK